MFGSFSKFFVIVLTCLILISQFAPCIAKPCEAAKDCAPGKCLPKCDESKCIKLRPPSGCGAKGRGEDKPCGHRLCVGKCGKPACTNAFAKDTRAAASKDCDDEEQLTPKACAVEKCQGECRKAGCFENRPENKLQEPAEDCESKSATDEQCQEPLRGSINCRKVIPPKEKQGPIFTSDADGPKPYVQCNSCSLQTAPDNTAVILACYDCKDLQLTKACSDSARPSGNGNSRRSSAKSCGGFNPPDYKSSGPNQPTEGLADAKRFKPNAFKDKCSADVVVDSETESEPEDAEPDQPSFVGLVYYVQIANYSSAHTADRRGSLRAR